MATADSTVREESSFSYSQYVWGDFIRGTKQALQALGIAEGMAFPGESGAPKRRLNTQDPRGFPCTIERERNADTFYVRIPFPGREEPPREVAVAFAPGVERQEWSWTDEYTGTAEALEAAGLVERAHLPGQPGMRKVRVTILADGSLLSGAPTANCRDARAPGAKHIERASKTTYRVSVFIPREEGEHRFQTLRRSRDEWEERMAALPRPAPLVSRAREAEAQKRRARMRLVWSRPAFVPTITLPSVASTL